MPKTETDWEAESDAHTLMRAAAIEADKARFTRASKAAKAMLKTKIAEQAALQKVAAGKKA